MAKTVERWNAQRMRWEEFTVPEPTFQTAPAASIVSAPSTPAPTMQASLSPVDTGRGWVTIVESSIGAFQQDVTPVNLDRALANWAVYACMSLIAGDIAKLRLKLVEEGSDEIWRKARSAAFDHVIRKPNHYQTRQQFVESWLLSKLGPHGNTYVLKQRDRRGIVVAMHVLNPSYGEPLVALDGSVFYRFNAQADSEGRLAGIRDVEVIIPASEIIHDRGPCLFHPLVGVSPLYACALAATQGQSIQTNSEAFFRNRSMPGGVITAPGVISRELAEQVKATWATRYSGENAGRTAILSEGLKYEPFAATARDSQVAEQLGLTAKMVCSAFHVPPFKIGIEGLPAGQKVEDMNRIYYADCLQGLIESIEVLLDEGLGLDQTGRALGTEFDLDDLLRMDTASLITSIRDAVGAGVMAPDEGRLKLNLPPATGGNSPYLQQQNYSLAALAKRDAQADPFAAPNAPAPADDEEDEDQTEEVMRQVEAQAKVKPLLHLVRRAA